MKNKLKKSLIKLKKKLNFFSSIFASNFLFFFKRQIINKLINLKNDVKNETIRNNRNDSMEKPFIKIKTKKMMNFYFFINDG